jgi:hypothetical protein
MWFLHVEDRPCSWLKWFPFAALATREANQIPPVFSYNIPREEIQIIPALDKGVLLGHADLWVYMTILYGRHS